MADDYDREEVAYHMRHKGKIPRLASNPEVIAKFDELFRRNGWVPEPGRSSFETFVEYAKAFGSDALNGERTPFEAKWDDRSLYAAATQRANLGTSSELRRVVEAVQTNALRDELLEKMLKRDLSGPRQAPADRVTQERIQDESDRRNRIANAVSAEWSEVERQREAREANHRAATAPKPPPAEPVRQNLHDAVSNAYDAHAGGEE